ncbi:hypothetical protein P3383_22245 [Vibrio parahaemolyticus]|nr:hypothetical protein [Vibrio parahaemolyticus]
MSEMVFNNTFNNGENARFNACVGNNGWQSLETYSDGYDEAVTVLYESAKSYRTPLDVIIHPIVFSARHRIELFLKAAIKSLGEMRSELEVSDEKLIKTHDLNKLWELFKEKAQVCDRRFNDFLCDSEEIILEFAEIDPTAETFRYPYSQDNQKHLVSTPVINIEVFYERYRFLSEKMDDMFYKLEALVHEYQQGTFTSKLSRHDLYLIAKIIPLRKDWGSTEFVEIRGKIMSDYELGSRNFSEALNVIQKHREFSSLIGVEIAVETIAPEKIEHALALSKEIDDSEANSTALFDPEVFEVRRRVYESFMENFSDSEMVTLFTLFELGSMNYYSESFDYLFNKYTQENSKEECIQHLYTNRMMVKYVLNALRKLGQQSSLGALEKYA